jgi:CRISPR/Cas system endoribonuclease Cas6 (RAMP superfamily)
MQACVCIISSNLKKMKSKNKKADEVLNLLYEFVGEFEENLTEQYNAIPQSEQRFTYAQFCIVQFANLILN